MARQAASIPAPAASTIPGNASQSQSQSQSQWSQQEHRQQEQQEQQQQPQRNIDSRGQAHADSRPLRGAPPAVASPTNRPNNHVTGVAVEDRRRSLPLHLSSRPSSRLDGPVSVEAENASSPEPDSRHEIIAAHRAAALRQLNGVPSRSRPHRPSKSTSARSNATDHPVVVRTYSGTPPLEHRHRHPPPIQEEPRMARPGLPPVEAFSFDDIMKNVEPDVVGELEAIAGICANYSYSPSDHYDAHLPPQVQMDDPGADAAPPGIGEDGQSRPQQGPRRMGSVVHAVPITYHSLDAVMSSRSMPPPAAARGPAPANAADQAYHGVGYGSVDLNEPAFHTFNQTVSVPREAPSPMALIDGSGRRRSSHAPSTATGLSSFGPPPPPPPPPSLTASPAPEVLTEVRRASRPSIDHHVGPSSRVHHTHHSHHHTHARTHSMFEQFVSWFPWSSDNNNNDHATEHEGGSYGGGGGAADYGTSASYTAENRLRGLLAAGHGAA